MKPSVRRFEEGLHGASDEVAIENNDNLAHKGCFKVKFEAGRGVRVVDGAALEICP